MRGYNFFVKKHVEERLEKSKNALWKECQKLGVDEVSIWGQSNISIV